MKRGPGVAWLESAVGDLRNIRYIQCDQFLTHVAAFHAQQCVEKCLKAVLIFMGTKVPKEHSTIRLYALTGNIFAETLSPDLLTDLDDIYIDARYPGDLGLLPQGKPTLEDVDEFYRFAESVFNQACLIVGVCESDFIEPQA